jgi:hypothetical protein
LKDHESGFFFVFLDIKPHNMIKKIICLFALCALIFSCSTQHVVTEHAFQKRKYRPGIFVSKKDRKADSVRLATAADNSLSKTTQEEKNSRPTENNSADIDQGQEILAENKVSPGPKKKREKSTVDPLKKSKEIVAKFIPMQTADAFYERLGRISVKQDVLEGTSDSAVIGFVLGGAAICCFLAGVATVDFGFGIYLMILAFAICVVGLIFSIRGTTESFRDNLRGKALGIIGIVTNGIIALLGLLAVFVIFLILGIYAGCN